MSAIVAPELAGLRKEPAATQAQLSDPLDYISASRLKMFSECRLKFYFCYVAQFPTLVSPALFVGQVVHSVLQQWNLRRWREEPVDADSLREVFAQHWTEDQPEEGIEWNGKEAGHMETSWRILEHYFEHTPIPLDEKPEAVEVKVERDFIAAGLPPIVGIIDLVREGGRIVDFKTTARTPDPDQAIHQNEIQMSCYCLLYREATGHEESSVELHHLVKTKAPKLVVAPIGVMTPQQGRRLTRIMESYVQGVEAEDYVPSPGLHCSYCDYFAECRAWKGQA